MFKVFIINFILVFILTACSNNQVNISHNLEKKEMIYSIKQAKQINMKELVKQLEYYSVIFVGDHHNVEKTHKFFEKLLKSMDKKGYNLYLANEWFTPKHDKLLKDFTSGKLDGIRLKHRRHWDKFTSFKWEYVEPLYETIKKNSGELYGINLTKEQRKKISSKQFDKMNKEEKAFYDSLDLDVSVHKQLVMPYLRHCNKMPQHSKEPCETRMYRVQVSWDTYMAQNVAKIAKKVLKTSKDKLFVFAGAMHMEKSLGVPLRFSRLSNLPFLIISNEQIDSKKELKLQNDKAHIVYIYKTKD